MPIQVPTPYGADLPGSILVSGTVMPSGHHPSFSVKKELRILVLEDVAADVVLMSHELTSGGLAFAATRVETREEFLREIEQHPPDLILSDHGLPRARRLYRSEPAERQRSLVP